MRTCKHLLLAFILVISVVLTGCGKSDDVDIGHEDMTEQETNDQKAKKEEKESKEAKDSKAEKEKKDEKDAKQADKDKQSDKKENDSESTKEKKSETASESNKKDKDTGKSKSNKQAKSDAGKGSNPSKSTKTETKKQDNSSSKPKKKESKKSSASNSSSSKKQTGSSSKPKEEKQEEKKEQTVTVSVSIPSGVSGGSGLSPTKVTIKDGDSALDATKKTGVNVDSTGSGSTAYVRGINGLKEFDEGPMSGWLIKVDGTMIDRGAGAYKVSANQKIEWVYTKDYTK